MIRIGGRRARDRSEGVGDIFVASVKVIRERKEQVWVSTRDCEQRLLGSRPR